MYWSFKLCKLSLVSYLLHKKKTDTDFGTGIIYQMICQNDLPVLDMEWFTRMIYHFWIWNDLPVDLPEWFAIFGAGITYQLIYQNDLPFMDLEWFTSWSTRMIYPFWIWNDLPVKVLTLISFILETQTQGLPVWKCILKNLITLPGVTMWCRHCLFMDLWLND